MSSPRVIEVVGYSDHDNDQDSKTWYTIQMEFNEGHERRIVSLQKRYSDFKELYDPLAKRFPEVKACRFPNKSVFNTQAQFTKDRRRQGFDDFVKV